jgi:hypothetical protein
MHLALLRVNCQLKGRIKLLLTNLPEVDDSYKGRFLKSENKTTC